MSLEVERTVEYQPRNAHIEAVQTNTIKHTAINGTNFTKSSDFIEFRLNNDGTFIDPTKTRLNCKFTPVTSGGTTPYAVFTSPSIWSAFSRMEIRQGGNILEHCVDLNRMFSCLSKVYSSELQARSGGSLTDLYQATAYEITNAAAMGKRATDVSTTPSAWFTETISVPISLSNLIGPSATQALPLALMKEPLYVRFYITNNVEEVLYSHNGSSSDLNGYGTGDFTLSDVSLEMCHIRYDSETMNKIKEGMPNELVWDGLQVISATNQIGYSNLERVILPNTSYSDVKNVIINQWYPVLSSSSATMGCSPLNGTYQAQLYLDGHPVRTRPVGSTESSAVVNSNAELSESVLSLNRPFSLLDDAKTQIAISYRQSVATLAGGVPITRYNFTNNNAGGGGGAVGSQVETYEITSSPVPSTTLFMDGIYPLYHASQVYFGYVGFDLQTNGDPSRARKGVDCRGKQMVYEARQNNSISAGTAPCICQAILNVGVKYVLDRQSGVLRTEY